MFWVEFRGWSNCDSDRNENQTSTFDGPDLQEQRIGMRASEMFCIFGPSAYDPKVVGRTSDKTPSSPGRRDHCRDNNSGNWIATLPICR